MKRGVICLHFSHGELGTAGVLRIPCQDAPIPASPSLEDLNLRFYPQRRAETYRPVHEIVSPCPEKPFLSPKASGALPAHPAKPSPPPPRYQTQAGFQ